LDGCEPRSDVFTVFPRFKVDIFMRVQKLKLIDGFYFSLAFQDYSFTCQIGDGVYLPIITEQTVAWC